MNTDFKGIDFYKSILKSLDVYVITTKLDGDIILLNEKVKGRCLDLNLDLNSKSIWQSKIFECDDVVKSGIFNAINNHQTEKFQIEYKIKDDFLYIEWTCSTIVQGDEEFLLFSGIDVTQEVKKEKELELFKKAIEFSSCGITIADCKQEDMPLIYVNDAFSKITGYSKSESVGKNCRFLQRDDREQPELENIRKAIKEGTIYRAKLRNYKKNGELFWNMLDIAPIFNKNGELEYYVGVQTDITREKNFEMKLEMLNNHLKQQVDAEVKKRLEQERLIIQQSKLALMGEMLGLIAHQWKQPLSSINMIAECIDDVLDEDGEFDKAYVKSLVADITKNIMFLANTVDDFRQFLKPDKTKVTINVKNSILEVINLLSKQFLSINIGIKFLYDESCEYRSLGYNNEFKHVVLNIINNAKEAILEKYQRGIDIPQEAILITLKIEDNWIVLTIEDCGVGFKGDVLENLFKQHFTTKGEKGTGLGLYISKMIIEESMNGTITAKNSESGGALFIIKIPRV